MVSLMAWAEQERSWKREVCERVGLDPARVIDVTVQGRVVTAVIFDGPYPEDRHTEQYRLPDSA